MLSTVHYDDAIDTTTHRAKPQHIIDYNKNKGGVDVMDQMLSTYGTKRKTNRWPFAMFFNMLDVAALAAYIIHDELDPEKQSDKRRSFIIALCNQLALPLIEERAQDVAFRHEHVKQAMKCFGVVSYYITIQT